MPRGTTTQTRTFVYDATTQRLTSATNPETNNLAVGYTYNADGTLATKHDANGNSESYSYDSYGRLTGTPVGPNQLTFRYNYTYTPAGKVASKKLILQSANHLSMWQVPAYGSPAVTYSYDNQGVLTSMVLGAFERQAHRPIQQFTMFSPQLRISIAVSVQLLAAQRPTTGPIDSICHTYCMILAVQDGTVRLIDQAPPPRSVNLGDYFASAQRLVPRTEAPIRELHSPRGWNVVASSFLDHDANVASTRIRFFDPNGALRFTEIMMQSLEAAEIGNLFGGSDEIVALTATEEHAYNVQTRIWLLPNGGRPRLVLAAAGTYQYLTDGGASGSAGIMLDRETYDGVHADTKGTVREFHLWDRAAKTLKRGKAIPNKNAVQDGKHPSSPALSLSGEDSQETSAEFAEHVPYGVGTSLQAAGFRFTKTLVAPLLLDRDERVRDAACVSVVDTMLADDRRLGDVARNDPARAAKSRRRRSALLNALASFRQNGTPPPLLEYVLGVERKNPEEVRYVLETLAANPDSVIASGARDQLRLLDKRQ